MPIWGYNDKSYLETNDLTIKELPGDRVFQKDVPYIMDLTFSKYDFQKNGEQITGYSISEINKNFYQILIYREMWLSESSLNTITKPFPFYHIVKLVAVVRAVKCVEKITIVSVMLIHMNMLTAIAKNNI